mgnify:CR=1 FL=1
MKTKEINWKNALIAGITGTLAFDLVGLLFTGTSGILPELLGEKQD